MSYLSVNIFELPKYNAWHIGDVYFQFLKNAK